MAKDQTKKVTVAWNGDVNGTHVYLEDGTEVPVRALELTHRYGELPVARMTVLNVRGEADAILTQLETEYLPPPLPKQELRLTIYVPCRRWWGGTQRKWRLERHKPLGTFGMAVEELASGWMRDFPGPVDSVITLTLAE